MQLFGRLEVFFYIVPSGKKSIVLLLSLLFFMNNSFAQVKDASEDEMPFVLGIYATKKDRLSTLKKIGFNFFHSYAYIHRKREYMDFVDFCFKNDYNVLASHEDRKQVLGLNGANRVRLIWDLPEELRFWKEEEMNYVRTAMSIKTKEGGKHPLFMYIPGYYKEEQYQHYINHLDYVVASCYTSYYKKNPLWIKWKIETVNKQIKLSANKDAKVIATLEMFKNKNVDHSPKSLEEAYFTFWLAVISRVDGVFLFSDGYTKYYPDAWAGYTKAVSDFVDFGVENILRFGQQTSVEVIPYGAAFSSPFFEREEKIKYPSVITLAKIYNGKLFIFALNTLDEPIYAKIKANSSFGILGQDVNVLGEDRCISIQNGFFGDQFPVNGVRVYEIGGQ